jgi:hypothetical protein
MRILSIPLASVLLSGLVACGKNIGDSCEVSSECSSRGDQICDTASPGGYCTMLGCDHDSCPDDSVCVRFFTAAVVNRPCDQGCGPDEICTIGGTCAPRTAELRFCMKTCSSGGDCRDGYECRDLALMQEHGGEPVLAPGEPPPDRPQPFCAAAPR